MDSGFWNWIGIKLQWRWRTEFYSFLVNLPGHPISRRDPSILLFYVCIVSLFPSYCFGSMYSSSYGDTNCRIRHTIILMSVDHRRNRNRAACALYCATIIKAPFELSHFPCFSLIQISFYNLLPDQRVTRSTREQKYRASPS